MIHDTAALVGLACVLTGLWLIYPPVSLIVGGVILLAVAAILVRKKKG